MKKLMFATALVASAAAFADGPLNAISFEGYTAGATFSNGDSELVEGGGGVDKGVGYFYFQGDQDGSSVKAFGVDDNATAPSIGRPTAFAEASPNAKYLDLSTEGGILWRSINPIIQGGTQEDPTYSLGAAKNIAATGTYLDTLVQFTPTEDGTPPTPTSEDKLVIWLNVDSSGASPVTNLQVMANLYDFNESPSAAATTFTLAPVTGTKEIVAGQWYRLTIKAIPNVMNTDEYGIITAFEVYIDGVQMCATTAQFTQGMFTMLSEVGDGGVLSQDMSAAITLNKVFPSLAEMGGTGSTPTLQGIGFKGSGALDDIVWTEEAPTYPAATIDFTLTWASGVTPVSYTIDGGTPVSLSGETSPFAVPGLAGGEAIVFTFTNADGVTKTVNATAADDGDLDASTAVYTWADYLGDAVAGAYEIDDANDLDMLRKGVAAGLATTNETFKQTANIDMTSEPAFAGVGTYNSNLTAGVPFEGTYDGQGYKISNILFTQRNYAGVFNQVKGGTIQNLTVENIAFDATSGEYGGAIVGNAGLGATLKNLVAMGSFGTAAKPCTHNVAGIAVRVCGGASNVVNGVTMLETLVKDCTNNAALYGTYTKAGGITALTQDQNGVPNDYVLFDGCVNNGAVHVYTSDAKDNKGNPACEGRDGLAGILGYVADGTVLKDCVNTGALTSDAQKTTPKIGELVGWAQGKTLDDLGGNSAAADKKMIYDQSGATITGFKYATVANNVATTVLPPLTAGAAYLLEGNVAASETPVATLAANDTIAFDAALGYTFAGTVGAAAPLVAIPSTSGTITTYSAGYFPRTATAGQNGSAANPFEIADVDDLQALAAYTAGHGLSYIQTADIDMATAGTFPGIGGDFTGTYDGGDKTISNLKFAANTYRGLFNKTTGATIKNLTIDTVSFETPGSGVEFGGAAFVGKVYANTVLSNLTSKGSVAAGTPGNHNVAGIAARVYANGVKFIECSNEASLYAEARKLGGILTIIQGTASVDFIGCSNSGTLVTTTKTHYDIGDGKDYTTGADGLAGIIGYANAPTTLKDCVNTGTIQTHAENTGASVGGLIGKCGNVAVTDLGGNKCAADMKMIGYPAGTITGFQYATVDDGTPAMATTTDTLATNTTFLLERNVAASATPVFTLAAEGEWIEFDKALGYTFAGTVAGANTTNETGTVVRYSWAAPQPAYPTYLADADADVKAAYDTWKVANGADTNSEYENQFLVNAAPATAVAADALAITAIEQNETAGWDITVECTVQGVDLGGTVGTAKVGNGYLAVSYAETLTGTWITENIAITASANGKVTVNVNKSGAKFMKVKLSPKQEIQN